MNSCSVDIKSILLADNSLGLSFGTATANLYIGKEPATPNATVTIYDTAGGSASLTFSQGENYFYDAIQIRIRNKDYVVGYALAHSIMTLLHGVGQVTINGTLYSRIACSSGPAAIGWDDNGRCIFVINFEIQRR